MKGPLIVVGIDTDVGKTLVATILARALNASYWKPIQCGEPRDSEWAASHLTQKCYPERYCLQTPCSPHLAAKIESLSIKASDFKRLPTETPLVIEGAGGLLAPLNDHESWIDAALHWKGPFILVHRHYLGSLNHFLLTIEAMKARSLPLLGVVFNGEGDEATERMLLKRAQTSAIGKLTWQKRLSTTIIENLAQTWRPALLSKIGAHEI